MQRSILIILMILTYFSASSQLINDSILVDGHFRIFHFKKPAAPASGSSLIFILHGSGGDGKGIMKSAAKLEDESRAENILLVYPDGYKKFWNECRKEASSAANIENIDEDAFFSKMIDYFVKYYQVNSKHVFAIGTSGGGHMAYKLALTMTKEFKAITAIIANLPEQNNMDCPESKIPISVMIINGTSDSTNPYNGGAVKIPGTTFGNVRSTEKTFAYWAGIDGYKGQPIKENLPDTDPNDGKTIERYTFYDPRKPDVVLLKVIGGRHDYPNDINVYLEAWSFFKKEMTK
jgi:polyhydroxybutyrate depolymerase